MAYLAAFSGEVCTGAIKPVVDRFQGRIVVVVDVGNKVVPDGSSDIVIVCQHQLERSRRDCRAHKASEITEPQ